MVQINDGPLDEWELEYASETYIHIYQNEVDEILELVCDKCGYYSEGLFVSDESELGDFEEELDEDTLAPLVNKKFNIFITDETPIYEIAKIIYDGRRR